MTISYPVVLSDGDKFILAEVPDLGFTTQGRSIKQALDMAKDAISLVVKDLIEDGKLIPEPTNASLISVEDGEAIALVDASIDLSPYEKMVHGLRQAIQYEEAVRDDIDASKYGREVEVWQLATTDAQEQDSVTFVTTTASTAEKDTGADGTSRS